MPGQILYEGLLEADMRKCQEETALENSRILDSSSRHTKNANIIGIPGDNFLGLGMLGVVIVGNYKSDHMNSTLVKL